eukprot:m.6970 g.6970  ORF g.6970 m.6970 type:complete len:231 (+) comp5208_c0_seq2:292-984(+)
MASDPKQTVIEAKRYMQRAMAYLQEMAPNFASDLRHIEVPPVNFQEASARAKQDLQYLQTLVVDDRPDSEVKASLTGKGMLTFIFLTSQVFVRGSKQFWVSVDSNQLFAYMAFATIDLTLDALSHAPINPQRLVPLMEELTSPSYINKLFAGYSSMVTVLKAAQSQRPDSEGSEWLPDQPVRAAVQAFSNGVASYKEAQVVDETKQYLLYGVLAVAALGVGWMLYRKLSR